MSKGKFFNKLNYLFFYYKKILNNIIFIMQLSKFKFFSIFYLKNLGLIFIILLLKNY